MSSIDMGAGRPRGQILALFGLSLTVIVLAVSLVIDGGNALAPAPSVAERLGLRRARRGPDLATWIDGDIANGTDANVVSAIDSTVAANGGSSVAYGAPNGPRYVSRAGSLTGWVGAGTIPSGTEGVTVGTSRTFRPYLLGIVGSGNWTASSVATARGGYRRGTAVGQRVPCRSLTGVLPDLSVLHGARRIEP